MNATPRTWFVRPATAAALVLLAAVASASETAEHPGKLSGIVVSSVTGEPIAGAYVGTGDFGDAGGANLERFRKQGLYATAETDRQGRFVLTGLAVPREHPLVVTHPECVRHDQVIALAADKPEVEVHVALKPAGTLHVTVVDASGNRREEPFLIRLEALDGHAFIPPGQHRHLSTFASCAWSSRVRAGEFSYTELAPGLYKIEVMQISPSSLDYHGGVASVEAVGGQAREVRIEPHDHGTKLTIRVPAPSSKIPKEAFGIARMPTLLVLNRNPALLAWDDGKLRHPEDHRLGRIVQRALFRTSVSGGAEFTIRNLPPATYNLFAGPALAMRGVNVELAAESEITVDIPKAEPNDAARLNLWTFKRQVGLEAKEYTARQLCEILTETCRPAIQFRADLLLQERRVRLTADEMSVWDLLEKLYLEQGWRVDEEPPSTVVLRPKPTTQQGEPSAASSSAGAVKGRVVDATGRPVASACVVICDQASGIPLAPATLRPFTEGFLQNRETMDLAHAVTDEQGSFAFDVPAGTYRLVCQSWKDAQAMKGLLEVNGKTIELHGVADDVHVPSDAAKELVLRPLGTGVLVMDEEVGNDETLLVISTAPPRADPILAFAGWGGPFLQNMIGGNRMPRGETTIHGLPEGKVYLTVFAADNNPGFGAGEATIRPGQKSFAYVPFVASWSDGLHDPPQRLVPLVEEVKGLSPDEQDRVRESLKAEGIDLGPSGRRWELLQRIGPHLDRRIELPSGTATTIGDFMAAMGYVDLQRVIERRQARRSGTPAQGSPQPSKPAGTEAVGYEQAFVDLFNQLAENYPCFEIKGINWAAVGDELLPRAKQVKTDEQFGLLCMELVARLEDSHAQLGKGSIDPPAPPYARWDPGLACLIDDRDQPVVYYVDPRGPAETVGVQVGMTVLSINGKPATEVIEQCMKETSRYWGYSSRRYLRYQAARWFVRQTERGATVRIETQTPDGERQTFDLPAVLDVRYLPRLPVPIAGVSDSGDVSWTMLDGNVGYVYVRRIRGDLIEKLDQAVSELKGAAGMIIDVRGNSGGGFDSSRSHRNFALNDEQEPNRPRFKAPIALLIDARCISAGEGWASWFTANQRAKVFGETTAGASSRKTTYTLKNGLYTVTFPVKAYRGFLDRPIERRGLEPDVPLRQNADDLAAGRDTVLEAARQYLLEAQ